MRDKLTAANDTMYGGWRKKLEHDIRAYFHGIRFTISFTYTFVAGVWLHFLNFLFFLRKAPPIGRPAAQGISEFQAPNGKRTAVEIQAAWAIVRRPFRRAQYNGIGPMNAMMTDRSVGITSRCGGQA